VTELLQEFSGSPDRRKFRTAQSGFATVGLRSNHLTWAMNSLTSCYRLQPPSLSGATHPKADIHLTIAQEVV